MGKTESYKGLYAMHKYWGKKPFEEIDSFIKKYSNPGDVVLDSFCGSGITVIEALRSGRKGIGIDLNPIAIKLSRCSIEKVDIKLLKDSFNKVKQAVKEKIDSLYKRFYDGKETLTTHVIWKDDKPIEIWYLNSSGKKNIRKADNEDFLMSTCPKIAPKWFPNSAMFENARINVNKDEKVSDLFTKRAIVGLSLILDEIKKIGDTSIRESLEITFTGALSQASNLVFVIRRRGKDGSSGKAEVGSWVIGYWVPEEHFEINVWSCFENRFKRILKGKEDVNSFYEDYSGFDSKNAKLILGSATNLPLDNDSVDYVFIDPPHANRILYGEQSLMWNAWLQLDESINWNDEVIVSESKKRNKNLDNYIELLDKSIKEICRVLKKGKFISLAFNCFDDKTWIRLLNILNSNGLKMISIEPLEYSATSVVQDNRKNALKTDFVFTLRNDRSISKNEIIFNKNKELLETLITELKSQNADIKVYEVMNELFKKTINDGYIFKVSDIAKLSN